MFVIGFGFCIFAVYINFTRNGAVNLVHFVGGDGARNGIAYFG